MRAMLCREISEDIGSLALAEVETPEPGPGEVRVRLKAAAVNFPDLLMIQGKYQFKPPLPFSPGMEGAGVIEALGEGVTGWSEGDAVVVGARFGCFAEAVVVPAASCRRKPERLSFEQAATYPVAYLTAWVALTRRGNLQRGETLLVHGASGGVGLAAVHLGKHLGATVIATSASDAKLKALEGEGADHLVNVTGGFREEVKALTGGRGADVIYDPVGGDVFDESVRCIAFDGRLLVIGFAGGRIPSVSVNMPLIKGFSVVGVRAGEYGRHFPEKGRENLAAVDALAESGAIRPRVHATYPLEQAVDAMRELSNRTVVGKVALRM